MDDDRLSRLRMRTFRWNPGEDTTGYFAAEVQVGRVRWFRWSHVHGRGREELGTQSRSELEQHGPPMDVPDRVLGQVLEAMAEA
ncbi:MAG: hypothetical protein ACK6CU_16705 [Deltaproteobacteria bacterium]